MNVLVDVTHPAHIHFFKHAVATWKRQGHQVQIVARDKDLTLQLLHEYSYDYTCLSKISKGAVGLVLELIEHQSKLFKVAKAFQADVMLNVSGIFITHVGKLLGIKTIAFSDTESATLSNRVAFPFADVVCTPLCYKDDWGKKHIRYDGYQELAYLHPSRFTPDPSVLAELDLEKDMPFFVVRFVSWGASHDIGQWGFSKAEKSALVEILEEYGQVILTSEEKSASKLVGRNKPIPPTEIHNLLYYATMYIGEGGTMAMEAAVLGTPSIFVSTLTGGNWEELEHKYHLLYAFREGGSAIAKVHELLAVDNLKEMWRARREYLLADKIDVTQLIVNVVEQVATEEGINELQ